MLILGGVIAFFNGILLAHILAVFRFSVKAGSFLVIDVGRRIHPDLTVASTDCRSRGCNRSLGTVHNRSSRSRRHLSNGPMPMRLFRRVRNGRDWDST